MEVLHFGIYENVNQAKAILNKIEVPIDDEKYQEVRKLLQGSEGYVGLFTRLAYGVNSKYKKNLIIDKEKAATIDQLKTLKKALDEKKHVFEFLPGKLADYESYEDIIDGYEVAKRRYKSKQMFKEFPSAQKKLVDLKDDDQVSLLANLYDNENNKTFLRKIAKYRNSNDLYDKLTQFINSSSSESFQDNMEEIKDTYGVKIIHKDELDDLIIVQVDYSGCRNLGSDTAWCIVGDKDTFDSYASKPYRKQYIIYLTDRKHTDNLRKIGATFDIAYHTAHGVEDNWVKYDELKQLLADHDYNIMDLNEPLSSLSKEDYQDFSVEKLSRAGMTLREVSKVKDNISARELTNFAKQELEEVGLLDKISFNDIDLATLFRMGFDRDEVLSKKKWGKSENIHYYNWYEDFAQTTKAERIKYKLYDKLDWSSDFEHLKNAKVPRKMILDKKTDWESYDVKHLNNEEILVHVNNFSLPSMLDNNKAGLDRDKLIAAKEKFYEEDFVDSYHGKKYSIKKEEIDDTIKSKVLADMSEITVETLLNYIKIDKEDVLTKKEKFSPKDLNDSIQYYRQGEKIPMVEWKLSKEDILKYNLIERSPDGISGEVFTKFNKDEIEELGLLNKLTSNDPRYREERLRASIQDLTEVGYTRDELIEKFGGKEELRNFIGTYTDDLDFYKKHIEKVGEKEPKSDWDDKPKTLVEQIRVSKGTYEVDIDPTLTAFKFTGLTKEDIPFDDRGWKTDFKSLVDRPQVDQYQTIINFLRDYGYLDDLGEEWQMTDTIAEWLLSNNHNTSSWKPNTNLDGLMEMYEAGLDTYLDVRNMAYDHSSMLSDRLLKRLKKFLHEDDFKILQENQANIEFMGDIQYAAGYQFGRGRGRDNSKIKVPYGRDITKYQKFVEVYEPILSKHMDFERSGLLASSIKKWDMDEYMISLVLVLAATNKFEWLDNIEWYGWDNYDKHDASFRDLIKAVMNKHFTNGREYYEIQKHITDEQRKKVYQWLFRYVREGEMEGENYDWAWDELLVMEYLYNRESFDRRLEDIKKLNLNRKRDARTVYSGDQEIKKPEKKYTCRICVLNNLIKYLKSELRFEELYQLMEEFSADNLKMDEDEISYSIGIIKNDIGYNTMRKILDEDGKEIAWNQPGGEKDMEDKITNEIEPKMLKIFLGDRYDELKNTGKSLWENSNTKLLRFYDYLRF